MAWPWTLPRRHGWYSNRQTSGAEPLRARRVDHRMPAACLLTLLMMLASVSAGAAAPADLKDGLAVGTPDEVFLQRAPFDSLTTAVVSAEFPDTTSVLVFRKGRL